MIVFDTSSPALNNEQLKRVFTAAVSSWIDRLLQGRDGRRRIVVDEEAWDLLSNARLVDSLQTRQRSAGHWGCATWLIVHGDIDMLSRLVPDLSEDERRVIPTLPQGLGVWRVGAEHPRMVRALAGPTLSALFDTSALRSAA